jgi:protein KRI1
VPTYEDIVGRAASENGDSGSDDEADGKGAASSHPWGKLDEEDEFDEAADAFEHTYNFRFEEPDAGSIVTHPRVIESLVRREDDTRKTKRETRAERKAAEKAVKEEETRRLKGAKRREMEGMLGSLKAELGDYVDWDQIEKIMDGDFDEGEWDRVVTAMLEAKAARVSEVDTRRGWV